MSKTSASLEITTIGTRVSNCYLLKTGSGFFLVDTGVSFLRDRLKKALAAAGCRREDLKLVVITHADFDHTGNCAWLKKNYDVNIAVHPDEVAALESGSMLASRKNRRNVIAMAVVKVFGLFAFRRFKPDIDLQDGDDLSPYGLDARIIHLPGHTTGHIGVLTGEGDLFCGDLLGNEKRPEKFSLVDDEDDMNASIARLSDLPVRTVYPGHGQPFAFSELGIK